VFGVGGDGLVVGDIQAASAGLGWRRPGAGGGLAGAGQLPGERGGTDEPQPGATQHAWAAGGFVVQVVGRVGQAGAGHPAAHDPDTALAGAGLADANASAGVEDVKADLHDWNLLGLQPVLGPELLGLGLAGGGLLGEPVGGGLGPQALVAAPCALVGGLVVVDGVGGPRWPPQAPQKGPGRLLPACGGGRWAR
jgi:hypothetical protein